MVYIIIIYCINYWLLLGYWLNIKLIGNYEGGYWKMTYQVTMEKELEKQLEEIRSVKFKEYTLFGKKVQQIMNYAPIRKNHKIHFNTFDKPLQDFKWVEVNNKILVFQLDPIKQEIHLCEYLPQDEVFE